MIQPEQRTVTIPQAIQIGLEHHQAGRLSDAERAYQRVLQIDPNNAEALHLLGVIAHQVGKNEISVGLLAKAVEIDPDCAEAHNNLGNALTDLGQLDNAVASCRRALEIEPDLAEAHNNLGNALKGLGQLDSAVASYRRALEIKPDYAMAHSNLGNALTDLGQLDSAVASYCRALEINPNLAEAYYNLGNALSDLGQLDNAVVSYRRALEIKPDFTEAHDNLGNALKGLGQLDGAVASYRRALEIKPDCAETHNNLGDALTKLGQLDSAVASYRRALEIKPDLAEVHSNVIFALDLMEGCSIREQQAERHRWYEQHGHKYAAQIRPHANSRDPRRVLRVGYVSADFRQHSAYYAFGPVMCGHDKREFEVFGYSGVRREDDATARLRQAVHEWRSTVGMSDDAVAEQIRRDGIDILVDLSGHSAGNRLLVFARKPAPIQVSAWGHATGTGLKTMDYVLADRIAIPQEMRGLFAEEIADLPCGLCYEPPDYMPDVSALPAQNRDYFTFGCVNRLEKVTDRVVSLWGRVMAASSKARLLIKDKGLAGADLRGRLLRRLRDVGGIEAERVVLHGLSAHTEHLKVFHEIDVGLDPFPQAGGISTAEALWMGVPVVTLLGPTPSNRYSASLLAALEMHEWIAHDEDEYLRIALTAQRDLAALAKLRQQLRRRASQSPPGNVAVYTRAVEQTYRSLWQRWCEGSKR